MQAHGEATGPADAALRASKPRGRKGKGELISDHFGHPDGRFVPSRSFPHRRGALGAIFEWRPRASAQENGSAEAATRRSRPSRGAGYPFRCARRASLAHLRRARQRPRRTETAFQLEPAHFSVLFSVAGLVVEPCRAAGDSPVQQARRRTRRAGPSARRIRPIRR